jgi:arylsulfatase A-like enzyme
MFQHMDLAPTVCDLMGFPRAPQFEGRSLLPALRGEPLDGYDALYACEASRMYRWAIRTPEWKLIRCIDPGQYHVDHDELYRVSEDPTETRNVLAEHPDVALDLEARLNRWREERLGNRPDPVRVVAAEGSPMEATKLEGLKRLGMTFDDWIADYKRRFCPGALPSGFRAGMTL